MTRSTGSRVVIGVDPHKRIDAVVVMDGAGGGARAGDDRAHLDRVRDVDGGGPPVPATGLGGRGVRRGREEPGSATGRRQGGRAGRVDSQVLAGAGVGDQLGRKTDDTDAYSIALVGLRTEDLPVVRRDERAEVLRLLSGRRRDWSGCGPRRSAGCTASW
jgi:transposase